jgi:hypothetical protein
MDIIVAGDSNDNTTNIDKNDEGSSPLSEDFELAMSNDANDENEIGKDKVQLGAGAATCTVSKEKNENTRLARFATTSHNN